MTQKTPLTLEFKGFLSFLILHELKQHSLCGDELAEKIGRRKGSKLTPGTIYPTLKHLRKYVKYKKDGRKKYYSLRDEGKIALEDLYSKFAKYFWGLKGIITRKRVGK